MAPIVLLTDFGWNDSYVGQVKGAILCVNPNLQIVDLMHDIPAFGIEVAAYILGYSYNVFPRGTVFVCVVDPGVGTKRRGIAIKVAGRYFVGPDNGVFSIVAWRNKSSFDSLRSLRTTLSKGPRPGAAARVEGSATIRELKNEKYWRREVSSTFHGRDVFGPTGAHIASSIKAFNNVGPLTSGLTYLEHKPPGVKDSSIDGRIIHIDRFGNMLTNIEAEYVPDHACVLWKRHLIKGIADTYGANRFGSLTAVRNSFGLLELAMKERNCAEVFGGKCGDKVRVKWRKQVSK